MNRLTEDEQEAAVRCIMLVERGCGRATEMLPSGKTAFAFRQRPDRIGWGVNKRRSVPLPSRARP